MIIFTSNNPASRNIAECLMEKGFQASGDGWIMGNETMVDCRAASVLEVPEYDAELMIVLSTHRSRNPEKVLTAHIPGNWNGNDAGGEEKTLNVANCSKLKILIQEIAKEAEKIGWKFSLEADHHGPTIKTPIIFVEIGCTEKEWSDKAAGNAIAEAVLRSLGRSETFESFVGFGGGHYAKDFTRMMIETDRAIGHIGPKYVIDSIDEEMFLQAMERNVEKISKVLILKKETNSSQKKKLISLCGKLGYDYELV